MSHRRARRALAFAGLASFAAGLVLLPAAVPAGARVARPAATSHPGQVTAAARDIAAAAGGGSSVTVTGQKLWDPAKKRPLSQPSSVTVDQTSGLTNQLVHVSWQNFTPSTSNASGPFYTNNSTFYAVEALECRGTNPTVYTDCYQADVGGYQYPSGPSGPPNNTFALTGSAGTGQLNILVETSLENAQLGCDQTHACSLVIVPGQGGVPAQGSTPAQCNNHMSDIGFGGTGNALAELTFSFLSVGGATGTCSWPDRLVVPLHFAPVQSGCPQRSASFQVAGSPMTAVAMAQWLPALCAGSHGMTIPYNSQVSEPTAVQDAAAGTLGVDVALTTRSATADGIAASGKTYVYAPVAISAISIDYWVDDNQLGQPQSGQPLSGLELNQRLLAKLLTTSYNPAVACSPPPAPPAPGCDTGVDGNPFDVFYDPEFQALNPAITKSILPGSFTNLNVAPTVVQGPSDMTWTTTRWIGADSSAAGFLKGSFDPWGMHVNTNYLGTAQYPTDTFTPSDPGTVWSQEFSPIYPYSQAVTYQALNTDSGSIVQAPPPQGGYTKDPPEPVGNRALFAILDQGDAALDHFPVAAIPNASGHYVTPSNPDMAAAVAHMTSNGDGTVQVNLADKTANAYPLTMVIYAMVPTSGISHAKAAAIARFLDFVAGPGQRSGTAPGQLAPGYLPLTASMRALTRKLAVEVAHQTGDHRGGHGHGNGGGSGTGNGSGGGSHSSSSGSGSGKPATPVSNRAPVTHPPISLTAAHPGPPSITRFALPALLILGALAALGGSYTLAESSAGGVPGRLRSLRRTAAAAAGAAWALTRRRKP